ncbi:uncharacterized protein G2W53_014356 [Senna tora]|uniref:Uncharacterized protein n=1 Tax=Senna tora TaxID=362788 RepID=A0A834WTC8_9FABA|nr:uncharacterized protein G2W53_014356 [Senna tora]
MVGSQKPSRITRQETCCASESNTSVCVVFANQSGFDAPSAVDMAWELRGSCVNIFRMTNRGRISETFTNYEAKDLLLDMAWVERGSFINIFRTTNRSFHAPVGVVLALEGRGSCLNIFRMTNRGRISETFMNYEAKDLLRNVFENRSGFDAPIRVVLAWEKRGSCLNIFRTTNRGGISETFTNYVAKDLLRKSLDHVLKYSGRKIMVGSQKPSRITRQKTCCASESHTSVRVVFGNRSGFDAPIAVDMAWEERGSCINIFRTTNRSRISETFTNYEANTSVRVVLANRSGFDTPIGVVMAWEERGSCLNIFQMTNRSQISETFTNYEGKDLLRNESNTSVRFVFVNKSGFHAPVGVVLAWEERGSCLNIFRTTNRGRISETFMNYEAKDLLRKSVDHVLTYSERQIMVGSQKPSRITRQETCCASESNTSVCVVFANQSGFDAPSAVDMAWELRGSCVNIFRMTNRGRISETFTNYEAKDLLLDMAWVERGSFINIFRTTNRSQISETFTNYEAKDLLRM